jgi:hypothetical protein
MYQPASNLFKLFYLLITLLFLACAPDGEYPESLTITVINEAEVLRSDEAVILNVNQIKLKSPNFNPNAFVIFDRKVELPSQANDRDGDDAPDQIVAIMDFKPGEKKKLKLRYAPSGEKAREYPRRTQAEISVKVGGKFVDRVYEGGTFQNVPYLRVPPEHTDHSFYIRYEGPGWESDKVGYRFYLDWRNATDIFGKKAPDMALQNVGQDGFDSYHEMSDWGMDILKVGESLGIGSIGMWHHEKANRVSQTDSITCEIVLNGSVESLIRTNYFGWKVGVGSYQLISDLSILAGSRMTKHELQIEGNPDNLCTGIVKHPDAELIRSGENEGWIYLANYGKQSLANDRLGMAILFKQSNLIEVTEDEFSHVVVLKPERGRLTYHFLAAWEKEPDGIQTKDEFINYLNEVVVRLDYPIVVQY